MKKQYLECGKIVTTHGVLGEIKVQPWCDAPEELTGVATLYFDEGKTPLTVQRGRVHKNMALLKLKGIDNIEQAQMLRGKVLWAHREDIPLGEGEHFIQDLIGLTVVDADDGHPYGTLSDVSETGANDVYIVTTKEGKEILLPSIKECILDVDVAGKIIKVHVLPGLI